jgi:hypothetical protein
LAGSIVVAGPTSPVLTSIEAPHAGQELVEQCNRVARAVMPEVPDVTDRAGWFSAG